MLIASAQKHFFDPNISLTLRILYIFLCESITIQNILVCEFLETVGHY